MPCEAHASAVSARQNELWAATDVVLITFGDPDRLAEYDKRTDYQFPILRDPDRSVYRSFGLGRGSVARIWGLKAARRYLALFLSEGRRPKRGPTDDTLQLGGDFVVGPDGTLVYTFWGEGPDDRPSVDELIAAAQQ